MTNVWRYPSLSTFLRKPGRIQLLLVRIGMSRNITIAMNLIRDSNDDDDDDDDNETTILLWL